MCRGHVDRNMEPQHDSVQSNKLHTLSVNVQSQSSIARGDKTSKLMNQNRNHHMPEQGRGERSAQINRLNAFVNLEKYREETKAWRDLKVKLEI
jgi:hypothetical protein